MVARTSHRSAARRLSHARAWPIGAVAGAVVGAVTASSAGIGVVLGVFAIVLAAWLLPRRATIGGFLVTSGVTLALTVGPRVSRCDQFGLDALRACLSAARSWLIDLGSALAVLGLAFSLLAIRRRGGDGRPAEGRTEGALVSLGIAGIAAIVEIVAIHQDASGRFDAITAGLGTGWGAPTIATGAIAGWIAGPAARRAVGWVDRALLVIGMGFLGVVLGSLGSGMVLALSRVAYDSSLPFPIVLWIPASLSFAVFGLLLAAPAILPLTAAAAALWLLVMARLGKSASTP